MGLLKSKLKKKSKRLHEILIQVISSDNFKKRFKNSKPLEKPKGWNLPFGNIRRNNHGDGYLLLGDAAGLVDPFTGEGIGNALESGKIAAEVIFSLKANNDFQKQIFLFMIKNCGII